jgi:hypothetical protein
MRNHTTPLTYELTSEGGSKTIAITPGAATQSGKFVISGIDPRIQDMRNYLTRFWPHLATTLDTDAAGGPVPWDRLSKALVSVEGVSPVLGTFFPHFHTRGATLMHLISVIALGYLYPQGARTQIPLDVDADYNVDLFYCLPIVQETLADPMETAQWTGFYDGGTIEMIIAASNVFDADYAGAVIKAPTTLRCLAEAIPSQREFLGVPNQWRRRQIAGGGSSPVLKNVGGETSMNGVAPGCGLAGLYWMSDITVFPAGERGPDGVDNITSISMSWRGQKQTQNLDGFFHFTRAQGEKRTSPIALSATVPETDAANWPHSQTSALQTGTTAAQRPSLDPQSMWLPIITPGRDLHTSKVQRVLGDLQIDFNSTVPFTTPHEFMTWELMEFSEDQANAMARLGLFSGQSGRKNINKSPGKPGAFRYTAIEFT